MAGFISEADAAVLLAARDVLKQLQATGTDQMWRTSVKQEAFSLGKFSEACEVADRGVFEALNVAHAHLDDDVATRAIKSYQDRPVVA